MSDSTPKLKTELAKLREVVKQLEVDAIANRDRALETPLQRLRRTHAELMGVPSAAPKLTLIQGGRDAD